MHAVTASLLMPGISPMRSTLRYGAGSACGKALGAVPTTTLGYERRFNGALKLALNDFIEPDAVELPGGQVGIVAALQYE